MIKYDHYESGDLYAIRYEFSEAGEGIPTHRHQADLGHNICVFRGSVCLEAEDRKEVLTPGVYDLEGTIPHSITALEPSVILNYFLHGRPEGWEHVEKHGVL